MAHKARKRFGQNFLQDATIIDDIVAAINPQLGDTMVEIGPGLGALTIPLAKRLKRLNVIELDRDIVVHLKTLFMDQNVLIYEGDALKFAFPTLGSGLRVVGNLPYNISTPLLFYLIEHFAGIQDIHVMLQKEVVERMVARPGASDYSRLSVSLQYYFDMDKVLDIGPHAFDPQPKVDSAFVRMVPRRSALLGARDPALFSQLVSLAFSQRRKTLRNTLRQWFTGPDLEAMGIDPGARAQTLSVDDYVRMTNVLTVRGAKAKTSSDK